MSLSNQSENLQKPAKYYFSWLGKKGGFKYYDKEKGEDVKVPYPFNFRVLDELYTIKGYHKPSDTGYWANEIRKKDIKNGIFTVKTKSGVEFIGTWKECKEKLSNKGCKLHQSVYIMYKDGETPVIANLQLKGSAMSAWWDFTKSNNVYQVAVNVGSHAQGNEKDDDDIKYVVPVFKPIAKISEESTAKAIELDKQLQEYLKAYFEQQGTQQTLEQTVESANKPQEQPKEQPKAAVTSEPEYHYDPNADNEEMPF